MIDFSNREIKTVVKLKEGESDIWFEIRYCSLNRGEKFKNDLELFKWIVLDWGDDFQSPKGKDWPCTEKNKEEFFWEVADLTSKVIVKSFDKFTFGTDETEVIRRLGKSLNTKKRGEKPNQQTTPQIAESA